MHSFPLPAGGRPRVAVLRQALPAPLIDGIRKDPKPGGYADSGADIAFCLRENGIDVVTPVSTPDPACALDWVFSDTATGLSAMVAADVDVIWANTILFAGHPIERYLASHWIVGQLPNRQQAVDDKFATNARLRDAGLPVAASVLVGRHAAPGIIAIVELTEEAMSAKGLAFPLMVKPVRGRGSQGVSRARDVNELIQQIGALLDGGLFGNLAIVEQYLPGEELTVTVMPDPADANAIARRPLVLPPVRRFNHQGGISPYNGAVAVTANSAALTPDACASPAVQDLVLDCAQVFDLIGALAPIRIDCRADGEGHFYMFDVNMKPNMTGAGRPGREDQDSLSAIAARAYGWRYADLLHAMLAGAWRK